MINNLKKKMKNGLPVIGTFFNLNSTIAVECLGLAGLDFLVIDTEHGPGDVESTMNHIIAAEFRGITPLVRTKNHARDSILKMLDIGAKGLIVPCIETVEEVKLLVKYGKFYPIGERGVAMTRAGGFGFDKFSSGFLEEYFRVCNEETMIIPQCETRGFLENIEEIVSIDGIDGIFIGPYDLSVAIGKPGQFDNPEFLDAIKRVLNATKKANKFIFMFSGNIQDAKKYLKSGFNGIGFSQDVVILTKSFKDAKDAIDEIKI